MFRRARAAVSVVATRAGRGRHGCPVEDGEVDGVPARVQLVRQADIGIEGVQRGVGLKAGTRFAEQGRMATPRTLRSRATLTAAAVFAASVALRVVEPSVAAP